MSRLNWEVWIQCKECSTAFRCESVTASVDVLTPNNDRATAKTPAPERLRALLVTVPNECPRCHSIRAVVDPEKFREVLDRQAAERQRREREDDEDAEPDGDEPETA